MRLRADRRDERRREAQERNAAWTALPTVAKIQSLHTRPGNSTKQLDKLYALKVEEKRRSQNECNSNRWGC